MSVILPKADIDSASDMSALCHFRTHALQHQCVGTKPVVCGGQALAYVYYEEEPGKRSELLSPRMRHAGLQLTRLNCGNYCGAGQAGETLKNEIIGSR